MRFVHLAVAAVAAGAIVGFVWPANADPVAMADPRWKAYPVRVEFSNGGQQYLSGAHVTLSKGGQSLASFDCSGAWVLFKVEPGSYKVSATITDQPGAGEKSATFMAPASGQKRVIIVFPTAKNQ
jgi:hypothetical protein